MTKEEFEALIEQQGRSVYSFCYYLTGGKEEADELYQDTMLKAMEKCYEIEVLGNPKGFLISLSVGIYKNYRKKWNNRQRIAPISESGGEMEERYQTADIQGRESQPEQEVLRKELYSLIRMETAALPEKFRIVVHMFYTLEMSVEEIAGVMHIPKGTVKSRLYKARKRLKEKLEANGYGEEEF